MRGRLKRIEVVREIHCYPWFVAVVIASSGVRPRSGWNALVLDGVPSPIPLAGGRGDGRRRRAAPELARGVE